MVAIEKSSGLIPFFTLSTYKVFSGDLSSISLDGTSIIHTLNPHSFHLAEHDAVFRAALESADILLPDGVGIVLANRFLNGKSIQRISGMELFQYLLEGSSSRSDPAKRKVFFLGSSPGTLEKILHRISLEYPNLEVGCYSPPFRDKFSKEEEREMLQAIREFAPQVLFVGMTAPKQEKWVYENKHEISAPVIASVGVAFDYFAGTISRPGHFWRWAGMEWLVRLLREPRRLWKRSFISGPRFVIRVIQLKMKS